MDAYLGVLAWPTAAALVVMVRALVRARSQRMAHELETMRSQTLPLLVAPEPASAPAGSRRLQPPRIAQLFDAQLVDSYVEAAVSATGTAMRREAIRRELARAKTPEVVTIDDDTDVLIQSLPPIPRPLPRPLASPIRPSGSLEPMSPWRTAAGTRPPPVVAAARESRAPSAIVASERDRWFSEDDDAHKTTAWKQDEVSDTLVDAKDYWW